MSETTTSRASAAGGGTDDALRVARMIAAAAPATNQDLLKASAAICVGVILAAGHGGGPRVASAIADAVISDIRDSLTTHFGSVN